MDRESLVQLMRRDGVNESSPGLPGVVCRKYAELVRLSAGFVALAKDREALDQLSASLRAAEADTQTLQKELRKAKDDAKRQKASSQNELDSLTGDLAFLDERLQTETEGIIGLKREITQVESCLQTRDRLLKRKSSLADEKKRLEGEIANLGEEYEANMSKLSVLEPIVTELEQEEARMSQLLEDLWKSLPRDAFDRMC